MLINNTFVQLPDEFVDYEKSSIGAFSESEFINNLMLNPSKYREFKRNINRINNIDNEINYLKSQEQNNKIDFVENIRITLEEYNNAVETANKLFDSLEETIKTVISKQLEYAISIGIAKESDKKLIKSYEYLKITKPMDIEEFLNHVTRKEEKL